MQVNNDRKEQALTWRRQQWAMAELNDKNKPGNLKKKDQNAETHI